MICLRDARRRLLDPNAEPCPSCVIESLRNPLGEALASLVGQFAAARAAEPDPDLRGLGTTGRQNQGA